MITAERLSKTWEDGSVAVRDVSFHIKQGETLALLGANGAGKTTTVHMLLGNVPPTSGRCLVAGVSMQDDPLAAKKHLAYVSENVILYGALTATQNLRFFARVCGRPDAASRIEEALRRVGLERSARARVDTFSKGMRQRLGLATALVKDPEALILDEPTTGLDPVGVEQLNALLAELRDQGKAILLVTHDLFRLHVVADRVGVIRGGTLAPPIRPRSLDEVQRLYLGTLEVASHG